MTIGLIPNAVEFSQRKYGLSFVLRYILIPQHSHRPSHFSFCRYNPIGAKAIQTKISKAIKHAKSELADGAHSRDQTGANGEDSTPVYWSVLLEYFAYQEEKKNGNAHSEQRRRQTENDVIGEQRPLGPGQPPFRTSTSRPGQVDADISRDVNANGNDTRVIERVPCGGTTRVPPPPAPPVAVSRVHV